MEGLSYPLPASVIQEANNYKYLGMTLSSGLNFADKVNYNVKKTGRDFVLQRVVIKRKTVTLKYWPTY
jgi:hypothetical protein